MAKLTEKQERFCLAYIETGNAVEAYKRAYDASGMTPGAIKTEASKTMAKPHIEDRISALRAPAVANAQLTLEQHLRDLKRLRDKADKANDFGPAIRAEVARGKAAGLYVENVNISIADGLADRLARALAGD